MPTSQDAFQAILTGTPRAALIYPPKATGDGQLVSPWAEPDGRLRVYNSTRRRRGIYHANAVTTTFTLAADAATGGRFWLFNNDPNIRGAIRQIVFSSVSTTTLVTLTSPNFTVERVTFTGAPTGAAILPAFRDTREPANALLLTAASTGVVLTAGNSAHAFQSHSALVGTGISQPVDQIWPASPDEDAFLVLRHKEGIVLRQATAGTLADTRSARVDIVWEEFTE